MRAKTRAYPLGALQYTRVVDPRSLATLYPDQLPLFKAVLDQLPSGVILAEAPSGRLLTGNRAMQEIFRHELLPAEEVDEYRQYRGFHPDGRPYEAHEWPLARSIVHGETVDREQIEIGRGDGTRGVIRVSSTPVRDDDGIVVAAVVTFDDITSEVAARKAAERQAQKLQQLAQAARMLNDPALSRDEMLAAVTEQARLIIGAHQAVTSMTVNLDWAQAINAVSMSERYAKWLDYEGMPDGSGIYSVVCERNEPMRFTQAELEAHPGWRGFGKHAADHPPMRGWLAVPLKSRDGGNLGLIQLSDRYEGEFDESDEAVLQHLAGIASMVIENHQLREREADEARQRQLLLEKVVNATMDGVWVLDPSGHTVFVNPAATQMMDRAQEELLGKGSHDIIHHSRPDGSPYPIESCPIYRSVSFGEPCRVNDEVFWRADGTSFPVEYTSTPIWGEHGEPLGAVQVFRDATEQREADARKAEFLAMASHELRTPLTAIAGFAMTLDDRWDQLPDEQKRGFLGIIKAQSDRLVRLVNDVLTLSRLERGRLIVEAYAVPVLPIIERVIETLPVERPDVVDCDPGLTAVCDPDHLEQMLFNYLGNANRYGGRPIEVIAAQRGARVLLEVRDQGSGVPSDFAPDLFKRFSQAERRMEGAGTGLGLSIVRGLAEAQGGRAWFEPNTPTGARFFIDLPGRDFAN